MNKRNLSIVVISILALMMVIPLAASDTDSAIVLCGHCGEVKGADNCCNPEAERHACGAIKGSPGCCKLAEDGSDLTLCDHCGQIKGSDVCCAKDAEKCDHCGKALGSPGCCLKVEKMEKEKHDHSKDDDC